MTIAELDIYFPSSNQMTVKFDNQESELLDFQAPFRKKDLEDLRWYIEVYAAQYTGEPDDEEAKRIEVKLITLGEALFQEVFSTNSVKDLFYKFQQQQSDKLLTIHTNEAEILALPWELLCEPQNIFLSQQQPPVSIRRYCVKSHSPSFSLQAKPKLRLLFIVSRPKDESFLNPRLDSQAVLDALDKQNISQIEIEFLRPATLVKLTERLNNKDLPPIDIIHFDGHGVYNEQKQLGYLIFESSPDPDKTLAIDDPTASRKHEVSAALLSNKLVPHNIALVVLSACQSATISNEPLGCVAAGLTDKGVPTVLAMVYSVLVQTTHQLCTSFYQGLAIGEGIGAALDIARQSLNQQNKRGKRRRGESEFELTLQDWFVPALYSTKQHDVFIQSNAPKIEKVAFCHDLPALQTAGFFGRSWELWQIERWFVHGVERITITGFGGQGKTYLAIETAQWLLRTDLFNTVCFVDFSRYQGADALRYALNTLGVLLDRTLLDEKAVSPLLQTRRLLWVWDNLESLAAETLDELLTVAEQWSTQCHFLFTTRQHRFAQVDYAEGNSKHQYLDLTGLAEADALAYFNQLWQTSIPPEQPYPSRYKLTVLFSKVAFHPLSLGLLAQQLKTRTIAELGKCLEMLLLCEPEGSEDKSLLASLTLSLDHLQPKERNLIKQLGIFQGGAMEETIFEITEINKADWMKLRPILEDTGLIQVENLNHLGIKHPYLKFHPTLAPVLWHELTFKQQKKIAIHYRQTYYKASNFLYAEDTKNIFAIRAISSRELPNFLYAVYAALQERETFSIKFSRNINMFLGYFGLRNERTKLINKAQQASGKIGSENWLLVKMDEGDFLSESYKYVQAEKIFQEIIKYLINIPNYRCCLILTKLGTCCRYQGNTIKAKKYYLKGLEIAKQLEQSHLVKRQTALIYQGLASSLKESGYYDDAKKYYEKSLLIYKNIDDISSEAYVQEKLGLLALTQNNLVIAEQYFQAALSMFQSFKQDLEEAGVLNHLGLVYQKNKMWGQAEQSYRNAANIQERQGNLNSAAGNWNNLAILNKTQGKLDAAENWHLKAIAVQRQGNSKDLADSLNNLAILLQNQPYRLNEAQQLAEEALTIREALDEASAEIWKAYNILARITDKQKNNEQAKTYRQLSRNSYLNFAGMPSQILPWRQFIDNIPMVLTHPEYRQGLEEELQQASEEQKSLVKAIQKILDGERNEAVLLELLDYTNAAIIHLILKGIENPESLKTLFNP
ncbi:MAG: CHAT domain-containing protein [Methylomarinum sp.]|nr:CHAT domain-containing protein [Methylomarinum sp.]